MGKTALLFPGQGSQELGMSQDFCNTYQSAALVLQEAERALGYSVADIMFGNDEDALNRTEYTQVCLLAAELCALAAARERGIAADAHLGFSLGEWAALVASGVIDAGTAFSLVSQRARAMQKAVPLGEGAMMALLGATHDQARALCSRSGEVWVSNYNGPEQVSVAGLSPSVDRLASLCEQQGIGTVRLAVSVPSHCPLMEPAARCVENLLDEVFLSDACIPLMMNASGELTCKADAIRKNMVLQLTMPVLFSQSLEALVEDGFDTFIEVGPGRVLSKLVKKTGKDKAVFRVSDMPTLAKACEALSL